MLTSLCSKLPKNRCGLVQSRSGLCLEYGITVFAGVIDCDYYVLIKIIISNYGNKDFVVTPDLRLAQLVIQRIVDPFLVEIK